MRRSNIFIAILLTISCLGPSISWAQSGGHQHGSGHDMNEGYRSKYVGEEFRSIKSLSADDIQELQRGGGWGLAKAAELNGVPGPAHILEMQDRIGLNAEQRHQVERLYESMRTKAVELGKKLIALEADLNNAFADGSINQAGLENSIHEIERVRAELRLVHLSTHLQTPDILSREQIVQYNRLRGYSSDPCQSIPAGHDPEMWKRHNGCN